MRLADRFVLLTATVLVLAVGDSSRAEDSPTVKKLKEIQGAFNKVRDEALKQNDDDAKQAQKALDRARGELQKSGKAKDAEAAKKLREAVEKAQDDLSKLSLVRDELLAHHIVAPPPPRLDEHLGVHLIKPTSMIKAQLKLKDGEGQVVERITKDSAADKAKFQEFDVLVKVDGKAVPSDLAAFRTLLAELKTGAAVDIVVIREGKHETIPGVAVPAKKTRKDMGWRNGLNIPNFGQQGFFGPGDRGRGPQDRPALNPKTAPDGAESKK